MALSKQDRTALEHDVKRLTNEIRNKEVILDGYRKDPSKKHLILGIENTITGLERELEHSRTS